MSKHRDELLERLAKLARKYASAREKLIKAYGARSKTLHLGEWNKKSIHSENRVFRAEREMEKAKDDLLLEAVLFYKP